MSHDAPTYRRGVSAALLGLGLQATGSAILAGLWAFQGRDPAVLAAVCYAVAGLPAWFVLALFFQQRRLERLEALDTAQLSRRAGVDPSLFERNADELSLARRRREHLLRWIFPLVSLALGAWLTGAGVWLGLAHAPLLKPQDTPWLATYDPLLAAAFAAGVALVAFVAGRFLAGMTSVPEWQLLRGGAGHLLGVALAAALLTVGFLLVPYASARPLLLLAVVLPALLALLGVEILLNQVLNLYRPQRAGELPRPAFDSRLLNLLATPEGLGKAFAEALNYQFGFEVTQSWFWKLLGRVFPQLLGFGVGVLLLLSCCVYVEPQQQALITTLGRLDEPPVGPGLHLKWPWPLGTARVHDVTRMHEIRVGSGEDLVPGEPILWTNKHTLREESLLIVAGSLSAPSQHNPSSAMRAPAVSLLVADIPVQYRIRDLIAYARFGSVAAVEAALKAAAEREVAAEFFAHSEDELLGPARLATGRRLKDRMQAVADQQGLGLEIVFVGLVGVHPHADAAGAFHDSVRALLEKETAIEKARQEEIKTLSAVAGSVQEASALVTALDKLDLLKSRNDAPDDLARQEALVEDLVRACSGEAAQRITTAEAEHWKRANAARGEAERFAKELSAYRNANRYYRMRRYLDVLAEALVEPRKIVLAAEREKLTIRLDLKDQDVFRTNLKLPTVP